MGPSEAPTITQATSREQHLQNGPFRPASPDFFDLPTVCDWYIQHTAPARDAVLAFEDHGNPKSSIPLFFFFSRDADEVVVQSDLHLRTYSTVFGNKHAG